MNLSGTNNFTVDSQGQRSSAAITKRRGDRPDDRYRLQLRNHPASPRSSPMRRFRSPGRSFKTVDGTSPGQLHASPRPAASMPGSFKPKPPRPSRIQNGNADRGQSVPGRVPGHLWRPRASRRTATISFTVDKTGKYHGILSARRNGGTVATIKRQRQRSSGLFSGELDLQQRQRPRGRWRAAWRRPSISNTRLGTGAGRRRISGELHHSDRREQRRSRAASFEATVGSPARSTASSGRTFSSADLT